MENKVLKPKIRFKGFTDTWEQRKFKDYGSVAMCKRIFKYETSDSGDVPFYKIGTFGNKADAFITNEKYEYYKSKFSFPNKGDILLSASGTIGRIVEYSGEKAYFQDSNIVWLNHNDNIKNSFLKVLYPIVKWDGIEGSTIKRLYNSNFLSTEIHVPKVKEQEKIGVLFEKIDNLITLHQSKYDKLVNVKKALLEKMFPKDGKNVPEIRFKGFTDTWEQRKLEGIYKFQYGEFNNNPSNGGIYPVYGANGIIGGYTNYNAENSVIIGHMGEYAGSVLWGNGKHFVTYNGTISKPRGENVVSKFGYYMLYQKDINKICGGSGLPFLSYEQLNKIEVCYPKDIKEQKSIANYLTNIDNLITLHQHKLEKLKNMKKSLLNKMFI